MWSLDLQHQHHLGACEKHRFQPFTPALLNKKLWGWGTAICDLLSPPDDFDAALIWESLYQGIKEGFPKEVLSILGLHVLSRSEEGKWRRSAFLTPRPPSSIVHNVLRCCISNKMTTDVHDTDYENSLLIVGGQHFREMSIEDERVWRNTLNVR